MLTGGQVLPVPAAPSRHTETSPEQLAAWGVRLSLGQCLQQLKTRRYLEGGFECCAFTVNV